MGQYSARFRITWGGKHFFISQDWRAAHGERAREMPMCIAAPILRIMPKAKSSEPRRRHRGVCPVRQWRPCQRSGIDHVQHRCGSPTRITCSNGGCFSPMTTPASRRPVHNQTARVQPGPAFLQQFINTFNAGARQRRPDHSLMAMPVPAVPAV